MLAMGSYPESQNGELTSNLAGPSRRFQSPYDDIPPLTAARHHISLSDTWIVTPLSTEGEGFKLLQNPHSQPEDLPKSLTAQPHVLPLSPRHMQKHERRSRLPAGYGHRAPTKGTTATLLNNALKLTSLGVSYRPPDTSAAPVVTISSRATPNPRVVFDQHHFSSVQHGQDTRTASSNKLITSLPLSQRARNVSSDGTTTASSPSSSLIGLPMSTTAASSQAPEAEISTPSSPPPRRNAWAKPRSWADLATHLGSASVLSSSFSENMGGSCATETMSPSQSLTSSPVNRGRSSSTFGRGKQSNGVNGSAQGLEDIIRQAETHFNAPLIYPRGIVNTGNMCFANAILQVLVYCAPFYNLFELVSKHVSHDFHNTTPLMEAV